MLADTPRSRVHQRRHLLRCHDAKLLLPRTPTNPEFSPCRHSCCRLLGKSGTPYDFLKELPCAPLLGNWQGIDHGFSTQQQLQAFCS